MSMKRILAMALLTAGLALTSKAQIVGDTGDLILGFRKAGTSFDILVDVGQASLYRAGSSFTVGALNTADISTVFGAGWNSDSAIKWGVFGSTVDGEGGPMGGVVTDNTVWATGATALQRAPAVSLSNASSKIYNLYGAVLGQTSNLSSSQSYKISSANGFNGYTDNITSGGANPTGPYFDFFSQTLEKNTNGTNSLNLYQVQPGTAGAPATNLGYFTLNGSALTFNAFTAIPEPSTYAAILGVVALGVAAYRRQRQVTLA